MTSIVHARAFDNARPLFPLPAIDGDDVVLRDERVTDAPARAAASAAANPPPVAAYTTTLGAEAAGAEKSSAAVTTKTKTR